MKLLQNKGQSAIMFIDGGEHKMFLPDSVMMVDEDAADKLLKFYGFVIELPQEVKEEPKVVAKKKEKKSKKKKLEAFEG